MSLVALPDGVLAYIFEFLSTHELTPLGGLVCKDFLRIQRTLDFYIMDLAVIEQQFMMLNSKKSSDKVDSWKSVFTCAQSYYELSFLTLDNFGSILTDIEAQPLITKHSSTLRRCSLSESGVISPVFKCPNLSTLILDRCPALLRPAIQCPLLTELDCSRTFLTDLDLSHFLSSLTQLRILRLQRCRNVRSVPLNSPSLEILDLSSTSVTDDAVIAICLACPSLTAFHLSSCQNLRRPTFKSVTLETLTLDSCSHLTGVVLECKNLLELNLSGTQIRDDSLAGALVFLPALRILKLKELELKQAPIHRELKSLTSLDLSHSEITDEGLLNLLRRCEMLQILCLQHCARLSSQLEVGYLPQLRHLDCSATYTTDAGIKHWLSNCPTLTSLNLRNCHYLTAVTIGSEILKFIDLSDTKISNAGLKQILKACPSLRVALVENCQQLTKAEVLSLKLEILSLASCRNLGAILLRSPALRQVNISGMTVLRELSTDACKNLRDVDLTDTMARTLLAPKLAARHSEVRLKGIQVAGTGLTKGESSIKRKNYERKFACVQWQWEEGWNRWKDFEPEWNDRFETTLVNALIKPSESVVRYSAPTLGQHYLIDVTNMIQTNTSTHSKRRIRRLLLDGEGKITDASSLSEPSYPYHPPSAGESPDPDTFTIHQRQIAYSKRQPLSSIRSPAKRQPSKSIRSPLQPSKKERRENKVARTLRRSTRSPDYPQLGEKVWKVIDEPPPPIDPRLSPSPDSLLPSQVYHIPLKKHERERRLLERKRTLSKERQSSRSTPEKKARPSISPPKLASAQQRSGLQHPAPQRSGVSPQRSGVSPQRSRGQLPITSSLALSSVSPQRSGGLPSGQFQPLYEQKSPQNLISTAMESQQPEEPSPKIITITITLPPAQVSPDSKQGTVVSPARYYHVQYGGWTFEMHAMKKQIEALESKLTQENLSQIARYGFKKQMEVEKAKLNREVRRLQSEANRKT